MRRPDDFSAVCLHADTCALAGAAAFFAGIPDAAIVVNGPMWCYFYALRSLESSQPLLSNRMVATQLDNQAIVFGTEEYLRDTLKPYIDDPPAVICIENNCSAGLIGDDLAAIARDSGVKCPAVVFDSNGLIGGFSEGYVKASLAALDAVKDVPPAEKAAGINLLGLTDGYYAGENDREELVRLLELAGYEVNAVPGAGSSWQELSRLGAASLNVVVHRELGVPLAKALKERYGTEYIAPLPPYGFSGTEKWLALVGEAFAAPNLGGAREYLAAVQEKKNYRLNLCKSLWGELWFEEAVIAAPPSTAMGLAAALRNEWADVGRLTVVVKKPLDERIVPRAEETGAVDEIFAAATDGEKIARRFAEMERGLILGGSNENLNIPPTAEEVVFLPAAYPVEEWVRLTETPLMGVRGALYLEESLWNLTIAQKIRGARQRIR